MYINVFKKIVNKKQLKIYNEREVYTNYLEPVKSVRIYFLRFILGWFEGKKGWT